MTVTEASLNGTVRTILTLVVVWWVLRLVLRYMNGRNTPPAQRTNEPQRPQGDVRIERPSDGRSTGRPSGTIVDADFEEIK
jgi:hypothetical protein